MKLSSDERLLIESGVNRFKIAGPGRVWLKPWQKAITTFSIAPQNQVYRFEDVRTADDIPVAVTIRVLYRVDLALFHQALLPKLVGLQAGGWQNALQWRTESILRPLLAAHSWRHLQQATVRQRLQRNLAQTVAISVKEIGLNSTAAYLIRTDLPPSLQDSIVRAEQDDIEAKGRATVLKDTSMSLVETYPKSCHRSYVGS